jgi:release factor glutamine methyltransferase
MTINELLLEGRKRLSREESALGLEARVQEAVIALEAEVLLAHVLDVSREDLIRDGVSTLSGVAPSDGDRDLFFKYCDEVSGGKPIAYITREKEFYGMDFYVDERVLVPRPETEMIVDEVLSWLASRAEEDKEKEIRLLDVGTGSLCITAALIRHYGHIFAHSVDISEDALEVARINRDSHGLETHVEVYWSDLLSEVDEQDFDVIVANLPYIGEGESKIVDSGVERNEPSSALFGGDSGLELYKKMIQQILDKKVRFDLMVCEFGAEQVDAVKEMLNNFFEQEEGGVSGYEWGIKSDLAGIPRIFIVRRV